MRAQNVGYFERVLERNGRKQLAGNALTYADLSLFQVVTGLRYAFPKAMARLEQIVRTSSRCTTASPRARRIAAYLASPRRLTANRARHIPALSRAGRVEK